jgi:hypothetical protein
MGSQLTKRHGLLSVDDLIKTIKEKSKKRKRIDSDDEIEA